MSAALLELLIDASVRAGLIAVLVWIALKACRVRDCAVQHQAWTIVVVGMLAMPALTGMMPSVPLPSVIGAPIVVPLDRVEMGVAPTLSTDRGRPAAVAIDVERPASAPSSRVAGRVQQPVESPQRTALSLWPTVFMALYAVVAAALLVRLAIGWRAARLIGNAIAVSMPDDVFRVSSRLTIVESPAVVAPVTVGLLRPVVVLPTAWRTWSGQKLRAVLGHECAHARRRDPLVAFLARLNACLFWFHPVAWWLEQRLSETAELACDEAGALELRDRRQYAAFVSEIAADVSRHGGRLSWVQTGIGGGHLATRLDRLASEPFARASGSIRLAIVLVCAATVFTTAACDTNGPPSSISEERAAELQWMYSNETTVRAEDRPDYEALLLKLNSENPDGPWSERLGRFYASTMVGHKVQVRFDDSPSSSTRGLQEITGADWNGAAAKRAREILADTSDAGLLVAAAEYLRFESPLPRPTVSQIMPEGRGDYMTTRRAAEEERDALVRLYLERALVLDPDSVSARASLVSVRMRERDTGDWLNLSDIPPAEWPDAISALEEKERFERLPYAATGALSSTGVERFKDPNLDEYITIREQQARRFALDLLALAAKFTDHPDYGTAIFKAHITLGSLSMRQGDERAAAEHLLLAADAPASEEITYGRSVAYTRLVNRLIAAGERDAAAVYLERMAGKSVVDRERLLQEAQSVRAGAAGVIFGPGYMSY